VYISVSPFISDKNKHKVSDQTYNCPHNNQQLCAIMLAVRSNHPLGMFAYGFKEVGDYFRDMISLMDQDPTKYGYLGSSAWVSVTDRSSAHEFMSMVYFKNEEYLHAWAHDKLHTEGRLSTPVLPYNAKKKY